MNTRSRAQLEAMTDRMRAHLAAGPHTAPMVSGRNPVSVDYGPLRMTFSPDTTAVRGPSGSVSLTRIDARRVQVRISIEEERGDRQVYLVVTVRGEADDAYGAAPSMLDIAERELVHG